MGLSPVRDTHGCYCVVLCRWSCFLLDIHLVVIIWCCADGFISCYRYKLLVLCVAMQMVLFPVRDTHSCY